MKTKKKAVPQPITADEATVAATTYYKTDALIKKKEAAAQAAVTKINSKLSEDVAEMTIERDEAAAILKDFAEQDRMNWKDKNLTLGHIKLSFRTGARSVVLAKKETADTVIAKLKEAGLKRYLRVKEELDKKFILAEDKEVALNRLAECGIGFGNSETFYLEVV